jgi:hypothetical protein
MLAKNAKFWIPAIVLILQLFITLWVSFKYVSCKTILRKTTINNQFILDKLSDVSQREFLCFQASENKLDTTILLTNIKGVKNSVSTLLQNEDNFILCLPKSLCTSCYEQLLVNLDNIKLHLFSDMQIFCDKFNLRKVAVFCKDAHISEPHALVNKENIIKNLNPEKFNIPFILKVKRNGTIKYILLHG